MTIKQFKKGIKRIFLNAIKNPSLSPHEYPILASLVLEDAKTSKECDVVLQLAKEILGVNRSLINALHNLSEQSVPVVRDKDGKLTNFENLNGRPLRDDEQLMIIRR